MSIIPSTEDPALVGRHEWKETADAHVLQAEVGGLTKEEVKVEVEAGRVVQVSGERKLEIKDDSDACHSVQRSSCKFKRSFTLPADAKPDEVTASIENGVLTVTVPKIAHPKSIEN